MATSSDETSRVAKDYEWKGWPGDKNQCDGLANELQG